MDSRPPHIIVDDIREVPKAERKHYVPLSKELAKKLIGMTPIERGQWLKDHPGDIDLVRRIQKEAKRTKKRVRAGIEKYRPGTKVDPDRDRGATNDLRREILRAQHEHAPRAAGDGPGPSSESSAPAGRAEGGSS